MKFVFYLSFFSLGGGKRRGRRIFLFVKVERRGEEEGKERRGPICLFF